MLRHLRPQIAVAAGGLVVIGALLFAVSRQAFEQQPARGGQLVEALAGHPATLSPLFAVSDTEVDIARLLFSGLTRSDGEGRVVPDLAESWTVSGDGRIYTFSLRRGAKWHDGAPVTADDVAYTASLLAAELPQKTPLAASWERVTAEVVDQGTVRLALDEPYAPFMQATTVGLLPAHILSQVDAAELLTHRFSTLEPIGAGPYRLAQPGGLADDEIRLVRFDEHWEADRRRPHLDELVLRVYPTEADAVQALVQRAVQAMGNVPPHAFGLLGEEARLYSVAQPGYTLLYVNPANALFADRDVRQAMSLGLDRAGIVTDLLDGQGIVAASPIAPGSWASDPEVAAPPYDAEEARRMLHGAGWIDSDGDGIRDRDGRNITFGLATSNDPLMAAIAQRIRDDWLRIGIDAVLQTLDQRSTVHNLSLRAFEAMLFGWERDDYDPDPYPLWHSSRATHGQNYADWRDPIADAAMVQARQLHPDQLPERAALYHSFQQRFVEEEPALMLYHPVYTYAVVDPNLGGVQLPELLVKPADRFMTLRDWYVRTERVFRR